MAELRRLGEILHPALARLTGGEQATAYGVWLRAAGSQVTAATRPRAYSRGRLTIECASAVWANELTYLGPQILRRMSELRPDQPVKRLRFVVARARRADPEETLRQDEQPATSKRTQRSKAPSAAALTAARSEAEGVRDERLRAAILAALRTPAREALEGPGGGTPEK